LMWAAYEEWISRGVNQYWQVAVELERFYSFLRRRALAGQRNGIDRATEQAEIAGAAIAYLKSVRHIGQTAFERFDREIEAVLRRLSESTPEESE
jgi:hypothetical protein